MEQKAYQNKIIFNTLLLVVLVSVFGGVTYWLKGDMDKYSQDISNSRGISFKNTLSLETLAQLKQGSGEIGYYQKKLLELLPSENNLIPFCKIWMDEIARRSNVRVACNLDSTSYLPSGGFPAYSYFAIDAEGDYSDLVFFMREIEVKSSSYLLTLETMTMNINRDAEGKYHLNSRGRLFYTKNQNGPA